MTPSEPYRPWAGQRWSWLFFACVVALYILLFSLDPVTAAKALSSFSTPVRRVLPILAVVFGLVFVFQLVGHPAWIERYVGVKSGVLGWLVAIGTGILSIGPVYPWYVLLGEMQRKGMRRSLIAVFLYSRAIKPPLVPLMLHYFGTVFTVTLLAYLVAFAVINGLVVKLVMNEDDEQRRRGGKHGTYSEDESL